MSENNKSEEIEVGLEDLYNAVLGDEAGAELLQDNNEKIIQALESGNSEDVAKLMNENMLMMFKNFTSAFNPPEDK